MNEHCESHSSEELLRATRCEAHPHCFACSNSNPAGLSLRYAVDPDGSVRSTFPASGAFEGYPTRLHGGVVATILDGAMTNCLFAHGIRAVTAELKVRYLASVSTLGTLTARARLESSRHGLHQLRAEMSQAGVLKATATAKFLGLQDTA